MDARSSEPGLDIPQTRQRLEPALTSAPQPLQAKTNIVAPSVWFSEQEHFVIAIIPHRKPAKKVPISGRFLSFRTSVRGRLFRRGSRSFADSRAYRLLDNRKCIRHP
jgi:hypothetical protein